MDDITLEQAGQHPADSLSGRSNPAGEYGAELPELDRAILATVTYRDLFEYPVTVDEIHRYLHGVRCEPGAVRSALQGGRLADRYLTSDGRYVALKGRVALFDLRRCRERHAEALWTKALEYGAILASVPFVRMVAVTGSLAVNNPDDSADVDFMLVTEGGRMWSTRLLAKVLQLLDARLADGGLCVNHLVSVRAMQLRDRGLYVAQELAQMGAEHWENSVV